MAITNDLTKLGSMLTAKTGVGRLPAMQWANGLREAFGDQAGTVGKQAVRLQRATGLAGGSAINWAARLAREHGVDSARGVEQLGARLFQRTDLSAETAMQTVSTVAHRHGSDGAREIVTDALRLTKNTGADVPFAIQVAERYHG
jgi:hypothetical protein